MVQMGTHVVRDDQPKASNSGETIMTLLKRHRMAAGLSGADVAKKVKVSPAAYSSWETGTFIPKPKHCKKLAQVLGIDPMTLTRMLVPERSDSAPGSDHPGETSSK